MNELILEFLDKEAQCEDEISKLSQAKNEEEMLMMTHRLIVKKEVCTWLKFKIEELIKQSQ